MLEVLEGYRMLEGWYLHSFPESEDLEGAQHAAERRGEFL